MRLVDAAATEALGALLAKDCPESACIHLRGELGAGKTTLVRGLRIEVQAAPGAAHDST